MGCAVGFAGEHRLVAEPEAGGPGPSKRPVAPVCGERHDFGEPRHRIGAVRDAPWRQMETPGFADRGVFGDAEPAANFGGGESLAPELTQSCCVIFVPAAGRRVLLQGALLLKNCPSPAGRRRTAHGRRQAPGSTLARRGAGWHPRRNYLVRSFYFAAEALLACGSLVAAAASSVEIIVSRCRAA